MRVRIFVLDGASGTGREISLEKRPLTPASRESALQSVQQLLRKTKESNNVEFQLVDRIVRGIDTVL
jgi:hypothetical protein